MIILTRKFIYQFVVLSLICIAGVDSMAQSAGVKVDRNRLLIGERLQYELLLNLNSPGYSINLHLPDSIPHFDRISNSQFDTIQEIGTFQIHKKIILTSFDSGSWYIPSFEVLIEKDHQKIKLYTDSILVNVGYSPADSSGELRDIKPVIEVEVKSYLWYYVTAAVLLGILVGWIIYLYFKNRRKKAVPVFYSPVSPYEEAIKSLLELKNQRGVDPAGLKGFYTALSEIFRRYLSRKLDKNMLNKTTGDILLNTPEYYNDPILVSTLAEALRRADAVKFAKYAPADSESDLAIEQVTESIHRIEKNQPPIKP